MQAQPLPCIVRKGRIEAFECMMCIDGPMHAVVQGGAEGMMREAGRRRKGGKGGAGQKGVGGREEGTRG